MRKQNPALRDTGTPGRDQQEALWPADHDGAIRLNPDFANAYVNRGNMKIVLGLKDAARNDFEIALEMAQKAGDVDVLAAAKQSLRDLDDAEGS